MAKVKYRIREFKPTANQTGGHSVYAEAVVDNIITNKELARKVESRRIKSSQPAITYPAKTYNGRTPQSGSALQPNGANADRPNNRPTSPAPSAVPTAARRTRKAADGVCADAPPSSPSTPAES